MSLALLALEASASRVAARVLREPALYSVLVDLRDSRTTQPIDEVRFGYQHHRRSPIFSETLKVCWVDVKPDPLSVTLEPSGPSGREQFAHLASIQGLEFPPSRLELDARQLEPSDVPRCNRISQMADTVSMLRIDTSVTSVSSTDTAGSRPGLPKKRRTHLLERGQNGATFFPPPPATADSCSRYAEPRVVGHPYPSRGSTPLARSSSSLMPNDLRLGTYD